MKIMVSMPNTMAWIRPIKNSNIRIIDWAKMGTMDPTMKINTEPAKILPNNRKENDKSFEISDTVSSSPTAKSITPKIGLVKIVFTYRYEK